MAQEIPGTVQTIVGYPATSIAGVGVAGVMTALLPAYWTLDFITAWGNQVEANGIASRTLAVPLHRNALVRSFDVLVSAARAEAVLLGNAAQVREQSRGGGAITVVADFGGLLTVGSVGALPGSGLTVRSVTAWTGLAFAAQPLYPPAGTAAGAGATTHAAFGEMRTERLLIEVAGTTDMAKVLASLWVELPDPPSDLSIRVDAGPPVWSSPGPVRPGQNGWSAEGTQVVELGPALAALTGDPDDDSLATFTVTLTSRTPGRLELAVVPGGRDLSWLARLRPAGAETVDLAFELEGVRRVPLALPVWVSGVERLAFTATATLGPERAVPPVGPEPAGVADLVLDPDRSACARLPAAAGLAEVTALRLPLLAGPSGAEVRVVLLAAKEDGEPGEPLDGAVSRPVTLEPPPAGVAAESWSTFEFPAPVALDGPAPWAAVQVARGQAAWPLGGAAAALRRGPPAGPWQELPAVVRDTQGGRLRVVGHAAREAPLAPLVAGVEGAAPIPAADPRAVSFTPSPRGTPVEWAAGGTLQPRNAAGAKSVDLVVTSHLPGTVTLRDLLVTAARQGG